MFKVNTGCREQEVCKLRWDWEISVPELGTSVFLIPAEFGGRHENSGVKNRDERLVVLVEEGTGARGKALAGAASTAGTPGVRFHPGA